MLLGKMGMLRSENLPKIKGPKLLMLLLQGVTHPLVILSLNDLFCNCAVKYYKCAKRVCNKNLRKCMLSR